jgi:hypothetical protein
MKDISFINFMNANNSLVLSYTDGPEKAFNDIKQVFYNTNNLSVISFRNLDYFLEES